MSTLRSVVLVSLVLLVACGRRDQSQPATAQPATAQPATAQPATVSQPAEAQPPAQQASQQPPAGATQSAPPPPVVGEPLQRGEARVQPPPPQPAPNQSAPNPPAPATSYEPQPAPAARPEPVRRSITLPAGTRVHVRLEQTLDTRNNRSGDRFVATLAEPIIIGGEAVLPRGARCEGRLVESRPSGRFKGRAVMSLSLDTVELHGRKIQLATSRFSEASGRHRKRNLAFIGGGGGFGAALGAIAGGPAGALIGAGAGAAAGTTGAALTGKKNIHLAVETRLTFVLQSPVELR